jgi:hypothetical protein
MLLSANQNAGISSDRRDQASLPLIYMCMHQPQPAKLLEAGVTWLKQAQELLNAALAGQQMTKSEEKVRTCVANSTALAGRPPTSQ